MKVTGLGVRKHYKIKVSNRFADFENLSDSEVINRAWENIKENIKTSAKGSVGLYALKQHKPWFDEEYLHFFILKGAVLNAVVTGSKPRRCR